MIRKYENLSVKEKQAAVQNMLNQLLDSIMNGEVHFDDEKNGEPIQERIEASVQKAEQLQTPWFATEIIMENEWLRNKLIEIATAEAEQAVYPEADQIVVDLGLDVGTLDND